MTTSGPRAVVFDLDGTLVDSLADLHHSANLFLAALGRPPLDIGIVRTFIGDGAAAFVERALAASGGRPPGLDDGAATRRFLDIYESDPSARSTLFPGVAATLRLLSEAGYSLGVCTNKPLAATERLLDDLGIGDLFRAVVGGDSFPSRKPSPEPVLGVLHRLAVAPSDAAFVGDNEHDVTAARAAGLPRVYVMRYGYSRVPLEQLPHDGIVDRFDGLPKLLMAAAPR